MISAGIIIVFTGLVLVAARVAFETTAAVLVTVTLLSLGWMVIHGFSELKKM